jgi:HNH endonuclease/Helix-turn-helix domain
VKNQDLPEEFLEFVQKVSGKRARIVIDHILAHGFITTEELENTYGYKHPPRAVRDVREQGIPIETFRVKNEQGRTIAAYRFGGFSQIQPQKLGGRKTFSKKFKRTLAEQQHQHCAICNIHYEDRYLQIDHRIPYEIAGEVESENPDEFMLLCASCNRAKSWSCEHCVNEESELCQICYWASPLKYTHIALRDMRRVDIVFTVDEVQWYQELKALADSEQIELPIYIKNILRRFINDDSE